MQPRGKSKLLIDAMHAQPDKELWTTEECAQAMGTESKAIAAFLSGPVNQGWVYKHKLDGVRVAYSLQPPEEDPDETPFSCTLHGDGEVDLHGMQELESGGWRMTIEQAAQVRKLLTGELVR